MPSLELREGRYRVVFRFAGEKFSRTLKTANVDDAEASFARLKDNLRRAELGHLVVPEGADIAAFLLSDGRALATFGPCGVAAAAGRSQHATTSRHDERGALC